MNFNQVLQKLNEASTKLSADKFVIRNYKVRNEDSFLDLEHNWITYDDMIEGKVPLHFDSLDAADAYVAKNIRPKGGMKVTTSGTVHDYGADKFDILEWEHFVKPYAEHSEAHS